MFEIWRPNKLMWSSMLWGLKASIHAAWIKREGDMEPPKVLKHFGKQLNICWLYSSSVVLPEMQATWNDHQTKHSFEHIFSRQNTDDELRNKFPLLHSGMHLRQARLFGMFFLTSFKRFAFLRHPNKHVACVLFDVFASFFWKILCSLQKHWELHLLSCFGFLS